MSNRKWTEKQLRQAVPKSTSWRDLCRNLNMTFSISFRKIIESEFPDVDTSHFTRAYPGSTKYTYLLDMKFDKLTVIEILKPQLKTKWDRNYKCICKCECGNYRTYNCCYIIRGLSLSCGCDKDYIYRNHKGVNSKNGLGSIGDIAHVYTNKLYARALQHDLEFNINTEYLNEIYQQQNKKCALTGIDIEFKTKHGTASVDRIDSSKGYIKGNIQWVHKDINIMKMDFTVLEFIRMCKLVTDYNKEKYEL
jgi:hypothetical protein